ncbi:DEAD/DEAH box helicase [Pantoea ananatis]|uniref:DEAD/DEAH box helicase n=1 Tax=Pantoea ananas TaxID=553 RepID=UPI0011AA639C|nr:DEAD/DEAH box helicase [Pantoea ananatis]
MDEQNQISSHEEFIEVFDELLFSLFKRNRGENYISELLTADKIKKATWLASIAALGDDDQKNIASAYGSLLHLYDIDNEIYKRTCYILQSRAGNIVSSQHLPGILKDGKYDGDFGSLLNLEVVKRRIGLEKTFIDGTILYFTEFQKRLWSDLEAGNNVAISAPTSSGKSFVIKRFILEKIISFSRGEFVYIVPSKALINQVSNELSRSLINKATVMTTFRDVSDIHDKVIYVLTPERCLKLLMEKISSEPNLVFFDEVQNVEFGHRGNIYENILYRMTEKWKSTQFVMAGPYIENIKESLEKITDINVIEHKTSSTPVLQLKASITIKPRSKLVDFKIMSPTGNNISSEFNIGKALYSRLTSSKGSALSYIVSLFSKDEQNIVYAPRKNNAERWAVKISEEEGVFDNVEDERIEELSEFLSKEIHPSYSLKRMLSKGVAFHHGGLLDIARMEIEDLYSAGVIRNIVCTSTLLQGVNLPADRIVILSPKIGDYEMSQFEFLNLIGRAGRISTSLYGEIFCIDVEGEEWGEEKILNVEKKEIKSSVLKKLDESKAEVIGSINIKRKDLIGFGINIDVVTLVSYLRSQYFVDIKHFSKIMNNSSLSKTEVSEINRILKRSKDKLTIPPSLLSMNQFVDPLEQNELYEMIRKDGVDKWLINKFPVNKDGLKSEHAEFSEMNYYNQYKNIIIRLDEIFGIQDEVNGIDEGKFKKLKYFVSVSRLAADSNKWMQGKPYRFFIDDVLNRQLTLKGKKIDDSKVDSVANFVTAHITTNLNFILVKYLTIWSNVLSSFLSNEEKEKYAYILNLPSMLEMGSYNPVVLEIMSYGINRSTALEIAKFYNAERDKSVELFLLTLNLNRVSALHRKYLEKAGYGKNNRAS